MGLGQFSWVWADSARLGRFSFGSGLGSKGFGLAIGLGLTWVLGWAIRLAKGDGSSSTHSQAGLAEFRNEKKARASMLCSTSKLTQQKSNKIQK